MHFWERKPLRRVSFCAGGREETVVTSYGGLALHSEKSLFAACAPKLVCQVRQVKFS